ncbi:MAG TPA: hypothetical protein VFD92_13960 [Candidatus Binatia bacterium]|nr:hypothetical protein [Candidatus Binatia bacterium]
MTDTTSSPQRAWKAARTARRWLCIGLSAALLAACGGGSSGSGGQASDPPAEDFVAQASDFDCLRNWAQVRNMRIANKLGHLDEAVRFAEDLPAGDQFPVGTIVQLFPGEAMVKRGPDFDPDNHNWEYFELAFSAAGTEIRKRGRDEIINMFGGQCFGCHEAAKEFDFICEEDHGCVKLPVTGEQIAVLQNADPRCPR